MKRTLLLLQLCILSVLVFGQTAQTSIVPYKSTGEEAGIQAKATTEDNLTSDSLALVSFYNATGGDNWTDKENWLTGNIDTWKFITVADGRVTELVIMLNNLSGTIPSSIGNLTALTRLEIKGDEDTKEYVDITGSIPAELWKCTKLTRLQIKFTKITGDIPTEGISNMTSLYELNFQGTKLGTEIPKELFELPSLAKPYLHQSDFKGTVPENLKNATHLERVYLQNNKLESPLPFVDLPVENKAKVNLTGNYFTFEDVKPYHDANEAKKYNAFVDDYQLAQDTVIFEDLTVGDSVAFEFYAPGGETYAWFKSSDASTPISTDTLFSIASVTTSDVDTFYCKVQSSEVSSFYVTAAFVIKNVEESSALSTTNNKITFSAFPNPFDKSLNIQSKSALENIQLFDLTGKIILSENASSSNETTLDVSDLSNGVYLLKVTSKGTTSTQKLIKR